MRPILPHPRRGGQRSTADLPPFDYIALRNWLITQYDANQPGVPAPVALSQFPADSAESGESG